MQARAHTHTHTHTSRYVWDRVGLAAYQEQTLAFDFAGS